MRNLPRHIGFIMDGNRRWAREHGLPLMMGHTKGFERIEPLIEYGDSLGIKYMTFWAFSTENWNRDQKELSYLMDIFRNLFKGRLVKKLKEKHVKVTVLGELERFPTDIQKLAREVLDDTKNNDHGFINIALSYGGRQEILRAVNTIIDEKRERIDEALFSSYLYTKGQPDPDLIIRTGGEQRLSGFLPWQSVYSEFYFPEVYWPDFDERELDLALETYANRERRFGR